MDRFQKTIDVGPNRYSLKISETYEAIFSITRGVNRQGGKIKLYDDFCSDSSPIEIFGVKNPVTSLRAILKEFKDYIYSSLPPYIHFSAEEASRIRLYSRICKSIGNEGKYQPFDSGHGYYLLIRQGQV